MKRSSNRELSASLETFIYTGTKRVVKLILETKKVLQQYVIGYSETQGVENFELRERLADFSSSSQIMIYPKYMLVNKTSLTIISERQ